MPSQDNTLHAVDEVVLLVEVSRQMQPQTFTELHRLRQQNWHISPQLRLLVVVLGVGIPLSGHDLPDLAASQEGLDSDLIDLPCSLLCAGDDRRLLAFLCEAREQPPEVRNGRWSIVIPGLMLPEHVQQHDLAERGEEVLEHGIARTPPGCA